MAKHKKRNMRKARIKRYNDRMIKSKKRRLKFERLNISYRISKTCPENNKKLNIALGEYYTNLDCSTKEAFNELLRQMKSGEIYE